jgi:hypothetical protein
MEPYSSSLPEAPLKQVGTSKLALLAGLFSLLCPTGIGGAIGVVLGIFGLAQIRASRGDLGGATIARLGIVVGLLQLAAIGLIWAHVEKQKSEAPAVVEAFLQRFCENDLAGAAPNMSLGLRPTLDRGRAEQVSEGLVQALGGFEGLGDARSFKARWQGGLTIEAEIDLRFAKGAPARGSFTLVREHGALRVSSFAVHSPVLRVPVAVKGRESRELGEFAGGRSASGTGKLKSFDR